MKTIRWIGQTLGVRRWLIAFLCIIQSALAISGIVFALLMRRAIDCAVSGQVSAFYQSAISIAVLIFAQIILRALNNYVEEDTRAVIDNRLRQRVFHGILKSEYADMKEYHTGELMNRITSDSSVITDGAVTLLPSLLSMIVRIVGILLVMRTIEPWFVVVFLVGGILVTALSVIPRKFQKRLHKRVQEEDGKVRSFLQESLESLLVIRAFGCEKKIEAENEKNMNLHRRVRRTRSNTYNLFGSGLRILMQCGYLFGFTWCGIGILEGRITYGTLTAVLQLIGQIQTPFASMGSAFPKYATMLASAERLMEITEKASKKEETIVETREEVYERMENISFEHVSFAYDSDRPVLQDESFCVKKGEFAALIGSSGIGKSTIMKLLLSVYQPDDGEIKIKLSDGTIGLKELPRGMFAYVPQGNYLMSGPIWQVVGFADMSDKIDKARVEMACKVACAHEFITDLPKGYDTVLGERGDGLSEGQMQRIAVARAVYSGCPILLLDEATSALDADTERRMISALKEMSDCTVFLVTHRKDVWELCDRVLERKE
ncbi:MAG: ABC transporter ATP-binding protein [Tyzzerella sp.]|nr:ABC transporter ATP-binding protein [Tyzzerella sp.]